MNRKANTMQWEAVIEHRLMELAEDGTFDAGMNDATYIAEDLADLIRNLLRTEPGGEARELYIRTLKECAIVASEDGTRGTGYGKVPLSLWDEVRDYLRDAREPPPIESSGEARVLYVARCGWCGEYEGDVEQGEPCPEAIDQDPATGEPYVCGPHQFEYEALSRPTTPVEPEGEACSAYKGINPDPCLVCGYYAGEHENTAGFAGTPVEEQEP